MKEVEDWRKDTSMMPWWYIFGTKYLPWLWMAASIGCAIWYAIFDPRGENFVVIGFSIAAAFFWWYVYNRL